MKYYIIAGEASGDLHASNLIKELKARDGQAEIRAWGGDLMRQAGAEIVKHYRELAFMGFAEVLANLQKLAATENVLVREQACDAAAEMESNRLLQEMNRVRTQRQKRMLTETDTLTETAKLLVDTYQESPDTYEAEAPKAVKESLGEQAEQAYQVMLVNCNSYTDAIAQYNEERKDVTVNFLTTQDYTQVGVSSIYDPVGKQFSFIILLLP